MADPRKGTFPRISVMPAGSWRKYPLRAISLILAILGGCKATHGLPDDPLFAGRKPYEAKVQARAPIHLAYVDPVIPPIPEGKEDTGLAKRKPPLPQVDGIPTNRPMDDDPPRPATDDDTLPKTDEPK